MLNRRANERPSLIPRASRQRRETMLMSKDAFKHLLVKHCQREIRDGRDFCLVGLHVLEYEQVASQSPQAADQLLRLVEDICLRSQREKDRLCRLDSGHFILILPDNDKTTAEKTLERLAGTLAGAKTHYHQKPLRASTTFQIAHSKDLGANIESLLSAVGCCLTDRGEIALSQISIAALMRPNSNNFEIWLDRYKNLRLFSEDSLVVDGHTIVTTRYKAFDSWSHKESELKKFCLSGNICKTDTVEKITKRTRVLEELDHKNIIATTDFQFENESTLYLATPSIAYPTLADYLQTKELDGETLLDWFYQLLNLLIYLQSLVPPIVPSPLTEESLLVGDDDLLLLHNFEANYLFACLPHGEQSTSNTDLNYQKIIVSIGQLLGNLTERYTLRPQLNIAPLLSKLKEPLPKELNSAYKVRAALKPFEVHSKAN